MLKMNLDKLSKREIADAVSTHCADVGSVQSVIVMSPPASSAAPPQVYALVSMDTEDAVKAVVLRYGDSEVDGMALIRLEQEEKVIPRFLLDRHPGYTPHAAQS